MAKSLEQMAEDLEMKERASRRAEQEQSDLDAQDRRGGPFPPWYLAKLAAKNQTPDGSEIPDPTVMEPPIGHNEMPSLMESFYEMIRQEKLRSGDITNELDTPEQADDFDIPDPDELEPASAYEMEPEFEPPAPPPTPSSEVPPPGEPAPSTPPAASAATPPAAGGSPPSKPS